jgi:hypothetical protein
MTETGERQSAKIFMFPPRGRYAARDEQADAAATAARAVRSSYGEAWYHEEAIREAGERSRKS